MAMIEKEKKMYKCIPSTLELRIREYSETISTKHYSLISFILNLNLEHVLILGSN
jgi:hypothetical protein